MILLHRVIERLQEEAMILKSQVTPSPLASPLIAARLRKKRVTCNLSPHESWTRGCSGDFFRKREVVFKNSKSHFRIRNNLNWSLSHRYTSHTPLPPFLGAQPLHRPPDSSFSLCLSSNTSPPMLPLLFTPSLSSLWTPPMTSPPISSLFHHSAHLPHHHLP